MGEDHAPLTRRPNVETGSRRGPGAGRANDRCRPVGSRPRGQGSDLGGLVGRGSTEDRGARIPHHVAGLDLAAGRGSLVASAEPRSGLPDVLRRSGGPRGSSYRGWSVVGTGPGLARLRTWKRVERSGRCGARSRPEPHRLSPTGWRRVVRQFADRVEARIHAVRPAGARRGGRAARDRSGVERWPVAEIQPRWPGDRLGTPDRGTGPALLRATSDGRHGTGSSITHGRIPPRWGGRRSSGRR